MSLDLEPPHVETFCRSVVMEKISMVDNLRRRGLSSEATSNPFSLRGEGLESVNYLFLYCKVFSSFWRDCGKKCGWSGSLASSLALGRYV